MTLLLDNTAKLIEDEVMNPIRNDLSSKGIDTTGEASNSLRIEVNKSRNSVILYGVDYLEALNRGRGPGRFPPVDIIEEWTQQKPVDIPAFLIGRKIAREGTEIFKDNSKGIQLENKVINLRAALKKQTPSWAKEMVLNRLRKFHKQRLNK